MTRIRDLHYQCSKCLKHCRGFICFACVMDHGTGIEPTEEELERIIAEQRANLPPWWEAESLRMAAGLD